MFVKAVRASSGRTGSETMYWVEHREMGFPEGEAAETPLAAAEIVSRYRGQSGLLIVFNGTVLSRDELNDHVAAYVVSPP